MGGGAGEGAGEGEGSDAIGTTGAMGSSGNVGIRGLRRCRGLRLWKIGVILKIVEAAPPAQVAPTAPCWAQGGSVAKDTAPVRIEVSALFTARPSCC